MHKKRISISYTLYGNNYNYYEPLVMQYDLFSDFFVETLGPEYEFEIVVFTDDNVDRDYFNGLLIRFITVKEEKILEEVPAKMWRFYNVFFSEAEFYLFRDSDSIISERELKFLKIWFESKYDANIIRDSRLHLYPVMAGIFSIKGKYIEVLKEVLIGSPCEINNRKHFYDQIFLAEVVYPQISANLLVFSNFLVFKNEIFIRTDYRNFDFIGGYFKDNKIDNHWHDGKFISNFPLKTLKILNYSTTLVLIAISFFILLCKSKKPNVNEIHYKL